MDFVSDVNDFYKKRVFDKHQRISHQVENMNLHRSQVMAFHKHSNDLRISRLQQRSISRDSSVTPRKDNRKAQDKQ